MSGHEWLIASGILVAILGLLSWSIQRNLTTQGENIKGIRKEQTKQGETLTEIKIGLHDCVKRTDLDKELAPMKNDIKMHEKRITVVEEGCKARHSQ